MLKFENARGRNMKSVRHLDHDIRLRNPPAFDEL